MNPYCYYYLAYDAPRIFPRLIDIYKYVKDNFNCFDWFDGKNYITAKYIDGVDVDISLDIFCKKVKISSEEIISIGKKMDKLIEESKLMASQNGAMITGCYFYHWNDREKLIEREINSRCHQWIDCEVIDFHLFEESFRK